MPNNDETKKKVDDEPVEKKEKKPRKYRWDDEDPQPFESE